MAAHHMTCCCCGAYAGLWQQHWNRDDEYSICPSCVAEEAGRMSPEDLQRNYGKPDVNYQSQPTTISPA